MYMSSCPDRRTERDSAEPGPFGARKTADSGRRRGAEPFSHLVGRVIEGLTGREKLGEEEIEAAWRHAAGEAAARHSKPVSFKKASLLVHVASSSWLYELTVRKKEIVRILESELKGKKVKELRFRIGDIKERK